MVAGCKKNKQYWENSYKPLLSSECDFETNHDVSIFTYSSLNADI